MSAFSIGQSVGRYRILRKLGAGAMGDVYLAEDPRIERQLAIKAMRLDGVDGRSEDRLQRMIREAKAAGRLIHPNIVTLFDVGEEGDTFYLAFEYVAGTDLAARLLAAPPLTLGEVLSLARQAAAALHCAHQQGVVHRDIKPSNLLLDGAGHLKVADFGIAKIAGQTADLTMTGSVVGSPHYMSPEQVRGEPLDGRSDLFSLGSVLYEMVGGRRPFEGDTITTLIYQILHRDPEPPPGLLGDSRPLLHSLLGRLLAKDRQERFATAGELEAALAETRSRLSPAVLAGPAALAAPPPAEGGLTGDHLPTLSVAASSALATKPSSLPPPPASVHQPSPVVAPLADQPGSTQRIGRKKWAIGLAVGVAALAVLLLFLQIAGVSSAPRREGASETDVEGTPQPVSPPSRSEAEPINPPPEAPAAPAASAAGESGTVISGSAKEPIDRAAGGETDLRAKAPVQAAVPPARQTTQPYPRPPAGGKATARVPDRRPPRRRLPTRREFDRKLRDPAAARPGGAVVRPRSQASRPPSDSGAAPPFSYDKKVETAMTLLIASTPPDAFVVIDGFVIGRANEMNRRGGHTLAQAGEHRVVLRSPGMREYRLLVNASGAAGGKTRVKVQMRRARVSELAIGDLPRYLVREAVGFRVKPRTTRVVMDGTIRGPASQFSGRGGRWLTLPRGVHRVSLIAPGHRQVDIAVEVGGGATEKRQIVRLNLPPEGP